ncbi:hypothetical protein [Actinocorallia populi]|uniref:hypothetical protein n=1 Tax=Actinocorallia populi TaxID=2079200 RepID=UPI000D095A54|nr:hypothetical protein [Actinocorallia populi]
MPSGLLVMAGTMLFFAGAFAALVGFVVAWARWEEHRVMRQRRRQGLGEAGSRGPGSVVCAVEGKVRAGADGELRAPFSGNPCVWYRVVVTERTGLMGKKQILQETSKGTFLLEDATGVGVVVPHDSEWEQVRGSGRSFDRRLTAEEERGLSFSVKNDGGVEKRRRYQEWTLSPGDLLYVCGRVTFDGRRTVVERPFPPVNKLEGLEREIAAKNPYLIGAGSEREVQRRTLRDMVFGSLVCVIGTATSLALLLVVFVKDLD